MRRSEIFDSFVKIAQEKGMISNDYHDSKKKLEETGRADSLDISAIEALYGVKPNTPKDMEYKHNIMEDAHPNSVVISPSYDKLNGLVENNIERQNIILHIVQKTPDGLSTQRKYAEKELTLSLVRIANDLDNRNEEELRALADFCLYQVNEKKLKKEGVAPLAIGAVVLVAAVLGGIYLKNHMRFISDGLEKDHAKLMGEIDDLLNANSDWGVGYKYKPEFLQLVSSFKDKLSEFYNVYKQVEPAIDALQKPRDAEELMQVAKTPETTNFIQAYQAFKKATEKVLPMILKVQESFSSEMYKQRQIEDKGALTSLVDSTQILHGGKGLVADDFDDVKHALETYVLDIQNVAKALSGAETLKQKATSEMQQASYKSQELLGSGPTKAPTGTPGTASPTGGKTVEDLDKESEELSKMLGGFA